MWDEGNQHLFASSASFKNVKSEMGGNDISERSVYEDASALLMLSRGKDSSTNHTPLQDIKQPIGSPGLRSSSQVHSEPRSPLTSGDVRSRASSISLIQHNSTASPGPAYATLSAEDEDGLSSRMHEKTESPSSRSNSNKGIVAAAALAAAATVPLPLRKQDPEHRESKHNSRKSDHSEQRPKRSWPVPNSYVVDPDSGIITCICGYDDDDGFTIQCDHCNRWQHAICHGIRNIETAPDDYLCSNCHPRKLDVKRAKRKQQERLNPRNNKKRRKSSQGEESSGKSNSSHASDSANTSVNNLGGNEVASSAELKPTQRHLNSLEHHPVVYVPLTANDFKDRYVEMFVERHCDDDWVLPYSHRIFQPVPLEVKSCSESSRSFTGLPKLGLFAKQPCTVGSYIEEVVGEVDFTKKYYGDSRNNYRVCGTAKPKVFIHPHWPIYIDCRLSGNLTRFIRRGCQPNVELVSIHLNGDAPQVKFVLRALKDIGDGDELQIGWQWDLRHPIWHLIKGDNKSVDSLDDPDKFTLVHSVDTILSCADCACGAHNRDCYLLKVKKFSQSLIKSVKSKMNGRYKLNEVLQNAQNKNKKLQTPILSRLAHEAISNAARANELLVDFHAAKLKYLKEEGIPVSQLISRQPSLSDTENFDHAKPFKLYLVNKHFTTLRGGGEQENHRPSITTGTSNSLRYDESHITDLKSLPLPVELQLPRLSSMGEKALSIRENSNGDVAPELSTKAPVTPSVALPAVAVAAGPAINSRHTLKKKLSFADYKKKMKPI